VFKLKGDNGSNATSTCPYDNANDKIIRRRRVYTTCVYIERERSVRDRRVLVIVRMTFLSRSFPRHSLRCMPSLVRGRPVAPAVTVARPPPLRPRGLRRLFRIFPPPPSRLPLGSVYGNRVNRRRTHTPVECYTTSRGFRHTVVVLYTFPRVIASSRRFE